VFGQAGHSCLLALAKNVLPGALRGLCGSAHSAVAFSA
jgi:hypothetical protein